MLLEIRYLFGSKKKLLLENWYLSRHTFLEKMFSVWRTNTSPWKIVIMLNEQEKVPWKIVICSTNEQTFLENDYLFGEHIKPPGKVQKKVLL